MHKQYITTYCIYITYYTILSSQLFSTLALMVYLFTIYRNSLDLYVDIVLLSMLCILIN